MSTSYLLLHGLGGSGPEHWQTWLSAQLTERGERVYYPQFPNHDEPSLAIWLQELSELMDAIPQDEELIVITHSLGCILWFHYAATLPTRRVKQAIIVAPPSAQIQLPEIQEFFPPPHPERLKLAADATLIVQSSNDPFCELSNTLFYAEIGVPSIMLPDMGHINTASGHGPWPFILHLALTGTIPFATSEVSISASVTD
ncbi:RBBP9/YdeN family alpha/beta hydrolase [Paenibacillus kandeliae]|uniref:RBBP9/YdeN family alpha/beta hydrolase n=1 Tax=Paenibacillus kandeliae TaxID=3231269 RepID=UPI003459BEFF